MPNKKELWPEERKAIRATQVAFDISTQAQKQIKKAALDQDRTPSDQMRAILGLPVKKPVRPRLTISLSPQDYEVLAREYGLDPSDKLAIKERAADALIEWAEQSQSKGS